MRKFFLLMVISLFLAACSHQPSYQYLTTHPKELEQLLAQCRAMPISQSLHDMNCTTAENARQEVAALLTEVQNSVQGFGQKIMTAQNRLSDLKSQYQKTPSSNLARAIHDQQDYIARLLAICSYIGE